MVQPEIFYPGGRQNNLFAKVRHNVFEYFYNDSRMKHTYLLQRPDLLLIKLIDLIDIENIDDLKAPKYSTVWDFKLLNSSFSMPFVNDDSLKINAPVSLTSEN